MTNQMGRPSIEEMTEFGGNRSNPTDPQQMQQQASPTYSDPVALVAAHGSTVHVTDLSEVSHGTAAAISSIDTLYLLVAGMLAVMCQTPGEKALSLIKRARQFFMHDQNGPLAYLSQLVTRCASLKEVRVHVEPSSLECVGCER
jgi:hypothetical protein